MPATFCCGVWQAATAALLALIEPGAAVMYPDDSYTGTQALLSELERAGQVRLTAVDITDTDDRIWVQLGRFHGTDPDGIDHDEDDLHVVPDPGVEADAVISGTAEVLDSRIWRRGDGADTHLAGDLAIMKQVDWLGVNYYSRVVVKHDPNVAFVEASPVQPVGHEYSQMWEIYPSGMYELLTRIWRD